jgi:hypothetical protein
VSVVASVKAALLGATDGILAPLLTPVTVAYSLPRDIPRELVYGGNVVGPVTLAAMAGGARVKRQEDLILQLHVRVWQPGQETTEETDARAVEIGDVIALYIAANTTLGGVSDLKLAQVSGVDLDGWTDDDGAGSTLTLAVGLMSYLT